MQLISTTALALDTVKDEFDINDLRPEHYFDCTVTDTEDPAKEPITYTKQDQPIQYEVNFNQKLTINTQGSEAFTTGICRMIDEIINAVNDVKAVEDSMAEVDKMLEDASISNAQRDKLQEIKEQLLKETPELKTKLEENTYIADTPGFSSFEINEIESNELEKYFREDCIAMHLMLLNYTL